MFLIAGIQPKTRRLDDAPQPCPHCGAAGTVVQRIDYYFSLFFIPLIKVKTGAPFLFCPRCQEQGHPGSHVARPPARTADGRGLAIVETCPSCGQTVDPAFAYCPHCGQRLRAG